MEPVSILAISSSPRKGGNSDRLLDQAVAGAESVGANVEKVRLCDFTVNPCRECGGCDKTGRCVVEDDYQQFYLKYFSVDRIILASPVFFMGISAQAKALIDRGQAVWIRKYVLKKRIKPREGFERRGYLVLAGGSGLPNAFDCARSVAKYYYRTLDMKLSGDVAVNGVNDKGDVDGHPEGLKAAFELGIEAATP